jgi:hypothetical protein
MKKVYSMILIAFFGISIASAQRTVDWSVDEILEPTELESSNQTGTQVNVTAVLKNNGPDMVKTGDTVLVQIAIINSNNQTLVIAPGQNRFYLRVLDKDLASGDTMHYKVSFSFGLYATLSQNVTIRLASTIRNNGTDAITNETSPGTDNNLASKQVVWYNPQKWGVGIEDVNKTSILNVSPNPANDFVSVNWNVAASGDAKTIINILSVDGKLVRTESVESNGSARLNIADLESGLYFVEVESGSVKATQKIQVN